MCLLILILGITMAICVCSGDVLTPPYTVMLCSFGMLIETPVVKKDFLVSASWAFIMFIPKNTPYNAESKINFFISVKFRKLRLQKY